MPYQQWIRYRMIGPKISFIIYYGETVGKKRDERQTRRTRRKKQITILMLEFWSDYMSLKSARITLERSLDQFRVSLRACACVCVPGAWWSAKRASAQFVRQIDHNWNLCGWLFAFHLKLYSGLLWARFQLVQFRMIFFHWTARIGPSHNIWRISNDRTTRTPHESIIFCCFDDSTIEIGNKSWWRFFAPAIDCLRWPVVGQHLSNRAKRMKSNRLDIGWNNTEGSLIYVQRIWQLLFE